MVWMGSRKDGPVDRQSCLRNSQKLLLKESAKVKCKLNTDQKTLKKHHRTNRILGSGRESESGSAH